MQIDSFGNWYCFLLQTHSEDKMVDKIKIDEIGSRRFDEEGKGW